MASRSARWGQPFTGRKISKVGQPSIRAYYWIQTVPNTLILFKFRTSLAPFPHLVLL